MLQFVAVALRPSAALAAPARSLLDDAAPAEVGFAPDAHVRWASASGSLHVASWSAGALAPPPSATAGGWLVVVAGLPVLAAPEASVLGPADVAPHLPDLRGLTGRIDGPYAIGALAADGAGTVVNDPFGLHPLYHATRGGVSVIANRPRLAAAALAAASGAPVEADEDAVAWLLLNGHLYGDATGHRGVHRSHFGCALRVGRDGDVREVPWHEPPWRDLPDVPIDLGPEVGAIEARMGATIGASLAAAPGEVLSELTAGRDSRLVLELAVAGGVADALRFCTYVGLGARDMDVAAHITAQLGLRHERRLPVARRVVADLDAYVEQVRNVGGQLGLWEWSSGTARGGITLCGLTGESLRTNYPGEAGHTTVEAATGAFAAHRFGRHDHVRKAVLDDLRARLRPLFVEPLDGGARPEDLFDAFYVGHRMRRWIGDKPDRYARYAFPLYSPTAVRAVMRAGWRARAQGEFHADIATRAGLPIDDVAFERGTEWGSTSSARVATGEPSSAPPSPGSGWPTRQERDAATSAAFLAALEFDRGNRAFELVDRDGVVADVVRYDELDRRQRIELHHVLAVVLWLGAGRPDGARVSG